MNILGFIKKYKLEIIIVSFIVVAYFFLRFSRIMSLPLFTDEAIYIRWSQIARYDASWRFISLTDGKQPSFVWLTMMAMRFVTDPLLAGRIVSVFAGFFTMIGMYFVGKELFKKHWIGILSSFFYLIFPMALVYDRMALYDSLVGMLAVWSFFFSILLVKKVRLDIALILGMILGAGALTKSSLFFCIPLLFLTYILFDWSDKDWKRNLIKLFGLSIISASIAFVMYSLLRLSPFFHIINEKNSIFAYPLNEWIQHPFAYFLSNIMGLFDWLITYFSSPLIFLIASSFLISEKINKSQFIKIIKMLLPFLALILILNIPAVGVLMKKNHFQIQTILPFIFLTILVIFGAISYFKKYDFWKEKLVLFIWFGVPFVYLAFFGNTIYPRFIFFMTLFLIPLISYSVYSLSNLFKNKFIFSALVLLIFAMPLYSDFFIVKNIAIAPIPRSDYDQYINNWPAGGGVKEIVSYLEKQSENGKIYVASLGTFGSLPTYAVEIYLGDNRNVEKSGIYPVPSEIPIDLQEKANSMPVFLFVSNQQEFEESIKNWPLTLIVEYQKGVSTKAFSRLYKVNPK